MVNQRIHPRTIEAVKERADIVDVVGEHVVLKKKGKEFVGICPFHDDSRPSMAVSPTKQFYYCFSCGAGGNAIKFLMEFEKQNFVDVVLDLARKYQVPVETLEGPQQERLRQKLSHRESLYQVMKLAKEWFCDQLKENKGKDACDYLIKDRGFNKTLIEEFELGFAPNAWDELLTYLTKVQRVPIDLLKEAGLIIARKGGIGFYDRFRNRLVIPINDRQGRVIGFGGRTLDGAEPKYLNSPETEIFEKGKNLFALDRASTSIRKEDRAVIVEGYFDVISLHAAGITNAVAALGTALSSHQITQLCRCSESKRIVLNFDADNAGIRAATRAIGEVEHLAMQGQLELRVLHLPSGKDPDEYLKSFSSVEYKALIVDAPLWIDWQIDQIFNGLDLSKADDFQLAVSGLVQLLSKLPQSALRTHYLQKVAERLSGGQARLALQLEDDLRNQVKGQRWHGRSEKLKKPIEVTSRERSEADVLRLYFHCPSYRATIRSELRQRELDDFALHPHRLLWAAINELETSIVGTKLLEAICRGNEPGDELSEIDISGLLLEKFLIEDNRPLSTLLSTLLKPGEVQMVSMAKPIFQLRGSLAVLERQKSIKRCNHLIEAWSGQRLETLESCIASLIEQEQQKPEELYEMEKKIEDMFEELNTDALKFQELYYSERKHILFLDQQRCSTSHNQ